MVAFVGTAFLVAGLVVFDLAAGFFEVVLLVALAISALPALRGRGAMVDAGASAAIARTDLRISTLMVARGKGCWSGRGVAGGYSSVWWSAVKNPPIIYLRNA